MIINSKSNSQRPSRTLSLRSRTRRHSLRTRRPGRSTRVRLSRQGSTLPIFSKLTVFSCWHPFTAKVRHDNPLAQKNKLKRKLASGEVDASTLAAPGAKRVAVMMPEEYLPPNATLFVQNLMDGIGKEELEELFGTFVLPALSCLVHLC